MWAEEIAELIREITEKHGDKPFYLEDDDGEQFEVGGCFLELECKKDGVTLPERIVVGQ